MPDLDALSAPHPLGTVIMWSGLLADIPEGWLLADGANGTPDLVQFFARGSPADTEAGGTQGSDMHTLSQGELPDHDHTVTGLGHKHDQELSSVATAGGSTGLQGNANAGSYQFQNDSASQFFSSQGGGDPHENKPPFFELAYIQKVSN